MGYLFGPGLEELFERDLVLEIRGSKLQRRRAKKYAEGSGNAAHRPVLFGRQDVKIRCSRVPVERHALTSFDFFCMPLFNRCKRRACLACRCHGATDWVAASILDPSAQSGIFWAASCQRELIRIHLADWVLIQLVRAFEACNSPRGLQ